MIKFLCGNKCTWSGKESRCPKCKKQGLSVMLLIWTSMQSRSIHRSAVVITIPPVARKKDICLKTWCLHYTVYILIRNLNISDSLKQLYLNGFLWDLRHWEADIHLFCIRRKIKVYRKKYRHYQQYVWSPIVR